MNYTLIAVLCILIFFIIRGYKKGLAKALSGLVALIVTLLVLALLIMLSTSFHAGEVTNTLYSIILLVILGVVYGIVRLILKSAKAVSSLPIIRFIDKFLGLFIGAMKGILFIWIVFMFLIKIYQGPITNIVLNDINNNAFLTSLYGYNLFK